MGGNVPGIDTFSTLLEAVYESALDPGQWRIFLRGLAEALNAKSGMFRVIDERLPAVRANVHYNLDPELQEAHRQYYVNRDIFIEALRGQPAGFIAPGEQYLSLKQLQRTEFFADYMQPQDSYHVCGGLAMRNEEFTIKFGLQRDRRTGPFSRGDADFIRRFVPHIQRAARLGHLLDLARQQTAAAEQGLESLAVGVILLDEQEQIFHTNSKADALLRNRCGLADMQGRLMATSGADAERLRGLLGLVRSRAASGDAPIPETLLLTPGPGEPQLLLVACPIPPTLPYFRGPWPTANAAIFVSNLADAGLLNHEILIGLYGLTPTEARLAGALSRGHDLNSLSEGWNISRETLRTHLKRILGKTGTSRQTELVRLLTGKPWSLAGHPLEAS
ncbi:helix-turn-helix transcriptional regulator [Thiohalorhabdus sp. Cl-TMA]|uniref:Helix-turn-helix transcriptional regulator n=1 Tax=Thiohalorhabdus methylotrophus TaxID=3242694 RepID=A0ABV4TUL5_9GAMM